MLRECIFMESMGDVEDNQWLQDFHQNLAMSVK